MTLYYIITDPSGYVHEVCTIHEYEKLVASLRMQFGECCELIIRAELRYNEGRNASQVA
jgi:hypothetical protein